MKPKEKKPTASKELWGFDKHKDLLIIKSRYQRFNAKFTYTVSPLLFIPLSIMDISFHPTGLEKSLYSSLSYNPLSPNSD